MGLKKDIETNFGIPASYWNIGEEHKDYREMNNRVVLYGYASEFARREGAVPISSSQVLIKDANFNPDATRENLYNYIKANVEQFANALDA